MKRTKENLLKLLEAKMKLNSDCAKIWERNIEQGIDVETSIRLRKRSLEENTTLQLVMWLMTDEDFFNQQWSIHFPDEVK